MADARSAVTLDLQGLQGLLHVLREMGFTVVGPTARNAQLCLGAPLSAPVRESLGDVAEAVVTALPTTTSGAGSGLRPHESG